MPWFPMRVTYSRELKVKSRLEELKVECFLPMKYAVVNQHGTPRFKLVPAIHNLIFVREDQKRLTNLKRYDSILNSLRYMMLRENPVTKTGGRIMTVPDVQMDNFMRVASVTDDSVIFLDKTDIGVVGQKVMVTEGPFAGVVGVIKRIKKNKRVVVAIEGCAAVAITYVPKSALVLA